jgi:hypothetical protein
MESTTTTSSASSAGVESALSATTRVGEVKTKTTSLLDDQNKPFAASSTSLKEFREVFTNTSSSIVPSSKMENESSESAYDLFEENFRSRIQEFQRRYPLNGGYIHEMRNWTYFNWDKDLNAVLHHVKTRRDNLLDKVGKLSDQKRKQMIYHVSKNVEEAEQKYTRKLDTKNQRIHLLERTVSIISDATKNCEADVTTERLQRWNSGLYRDGFISPEIKAGEWRTIPVTVSIQENIVFRGPTPERIPNEMKKFLSWINSDPEDTDKLLQAGIAHFWFLVIHPFRDGNGRIARAITEMMLSRADRQRERFYSFATQMQNDRGTYQGYLIAASKGSQNLTVWLFWFLCAIDDALKESEEILESLKIEAPASSGFALSSKPPLEKI